MNEKREILSAAKRSELEISAAFYEGVGLRQAAAKIRAELAADDRARHEAGSAVKRMNEEMEILSTVKRRELEMSADVKRRELEINAEFYEGVGLRQVAAKIRAELAAYDQARANQAAGSTDGE